MIAAHDTHEPRWRRLPEERPRQIIEAALEVFGERGLAAARLEDIAKRAGVSKGTIYLYFPNKEALFCEMTRQLIGETIAHAEARLNTNQGSATTLLRQYTETVWNTLRAPRFEKLDRLVHSELRDFPALMQFFLTEVSLRSMGIVADIIRRGIAQGEFRPVDPDVAARILHALTVKHAVWCAKREQIPFAAHQTDSEVLEQIMDFFLHAIQARPTAPVPEPTA